MILLRGVVIMAAVALAPALVVSEDAKKNVLPEPARKILENAEEFDLISLDPEERNEKAKTDFHGWRVLGKTTVKDAKTRKQVLESLFEGIAKSEGTGARCFDPRHGIRATAQGKTVDLVICFECQWVYVYYDKDAERQGVVVIQRMPQQTLDKVLKDAGVTLPKQAK